MFFKIPKVVIGENQNYRGAEKYLRAQGVEVVVLNDRRFICMLEDFDRNQSRRIWNKGELSLENPR